MSAKTDTLYTEVTYLMLDMTAHEALDRLDRDAALYAEELGMRESLIRAYVIDQRINVDFNGGLAQ